MAHKVDLVTCLRFKGQDTYMWSGKSEGLSPTSLLGINPQWAVLLQAKQQQTEDWALSCHPRSGMWEWVSQRRGHESWCWSHPHSCLVDLINEIWGSVKGQGYSFEKLWHKPVDFIKENCKNHYLYKYL